MSSWKCICGRDSKKILCDCGRTVENTDNQRLANFSEIPKEIMSQNFMKMLEAIVRKAGGKMHITREELVNSTGLPIMASSHPDGGIELVIIP